jgi:valyl-tRNA synthetase
VERSLQKQGISRQELGREKFLEKIWEWKAEKGNYITEQMKRLGASADWTKEKFTLDPDMNEAVNEAFVSLFEKELIYRGNYMVNWSPSLQTAVSDLEVEYTEEEGKLYYFKYFLEDDGSAGKEKEFIPVATTRPETIFGDMAVCVHPEDERYSKFIGKKVTIPVKNTLIPGYKLFFSNLFADLNSFFFFSFFIFHFFIFSVIADTYVDKEFGTGALKITPAHDINDYELGKRHNLPMINIMNKDGTMNEQAGPYTGLDRFKCREEFWKAMQVLGFAIKEEKHMQRVPRSQRSGEIIEPLLSLQWFLKMEKMSQKAIQVVQTKELTIIPDFFEKIWFNWLENIHDWCISRQLWWGHRIPVYYVKSGSNSSSPVPKNEDGSDPFIVARSYEEALEQAKQKYGQEVTVEQDEDVLDTWFR